MGLSTTIPVLTIGTTTTSNSSISILSASPSSTAKHAKHSPASSLSRPALHIAAAPAAEEAYLQPRDNSTAHKRHRASPDLPKLSPSWNSSTTSTSDSTRKSDQSSWYSSSFNTSNVFPPLPNPYAAQSWNGDSWFNNNSHNSPPRSDSATDDKRGPMQTQSQTQLMLPVMSPTSGLTFTPAPPTFGGGLGAAFPEYLPYSYNPFQSNPISDSSLPTSAEHQPLRDSERGHVGPSEYTQVRKNLPSRFSSDPQALDVYRHIRAALPYIRAADAPGPSAVGQPFRSILDVASTAVGVLSGVPQKPTAPPPPTTKARASGPPEPKRARVSNGDKEKPATFCRGCGATETPEWRRGPLGPRTLCNACVSASRVPLTPGTGAHEDDEEETKGRRKGCSRGGRRRRCRRDIIHRILGAIPTYWLSLL